MAQVEIIHCIGCGSSAQHWDGSGFSIGVNDAFKWGHKLNYLVVVNHPSKFKNEPERFATIVKTNPEKFISHTAAWRQWFPDMKLVKLYSFFMRADPSKIYHAGTSPFVAMSYAFHMGARDIILWGVDMIDHKVFREGSKKQKYEVDVYHQFIKSIGRRGVKVWCGAGGSSLGLEIWNNQTKIE